MVEKITKTITLTTKCSGGCNHCPFSSNDLEKLFLSRDSVQKIVKSAVCDLIVLSGGEPFEHPDIMGILFDLSEHHKPVRIATGGFVNISPWIKQLTHLHNLGILRGISFGTDVISSRVKNTTWVSIWKNNINLLNHFKIPYSLTITAGPDLKFNWLNLWDWSTIFDSKPEFIYLRCSDNLIDEWIAKIKSSFDSTFIIKENI